MRGLHAVFVCLFGVGDCARDFGVWSTLWGRTLRCIGFSREGDLEVQALACDSTEGSPRVAAQPRGLVPRINLGAAAISCARPSTVPSLNLVPPPPLRPHTRTCTLHCPQTPPWGRIQARMCNERCRFTQPGGPLDAVITYFFCFER